jgi:hypothetical protein
MDLLNGCRLSGAEEVRTRIERLRDEYMSVASHDRREFRCRHLYGRVPRAAEANPRGSRSCHRSDAGRRCTGETCRTGQSAAVLIIPLFDRTSTRRPRPRTAQQNRRARPHPRRPRPSSGELRGPRPLLVPCSPVFLSLPALLSGLDCLEGARQPVPSGYIAELRVQSVRPWDQRFGSDNSVFAN